jgi:hypothetical protein
MRATSWQEIGHETRYRVVTGDCWHRLLDWWSGTAELPILIVRILDKYLDAAKATFGKAGEGRR